MNENNQSDNHADVPWPTSRERTKVPDTSMLPGAEQTPTPAVGMLKSAVEGAHETLDRLADRAAPAVQQLGERVEAAGDSLHETTAQLRETRDAWVESVRCSVRDNPLVALAAAVAVGAVLAGLMRRDR
jgi:ElaB/YqjD/DUF883 family membrane-anchored ribosome-binding protein